MQQGDRQTKAVAQGQVLVIVPDVAGRATVTEVDPTGGPLGDPVEVHGTLQRFGPYADDKAFYVEVTASHVVAHVLALEELRTLNDARFFSGAGAPVDGAQGTGAGWAMRGSLYADVMNANLFINRGTRVSPTWKQVSVMP